MFTEADLIALFTSLGVTIPGFPNELDDDAPDRAYAVSVSGGLGLMMDDQQDRPTFQVLTRGPSAFDTDNSVAICTADALDIDQRWINLNPMFMLGGFHVRGKGRLGGPPAFVTTDDRRRMVRAATYWCRFVRTPGLLG